LSPAAIDWTDWSHHDVRRNRHAARLDHRRPAVGVLQHRHPREPSFAAGAFGQVATAIGNTGAILGAIDLVKVEKGMKVREITVSCVDAAHGERVVDAVRAIDGVTVESVLDRTFQMHQGGKIHVSGNIPVKTRDDLSMAYTPGVARICNAIHEDVERAWSLTVKGNMIAVVSDGTAVLGSGDIGPEAAMPVMEGKAMLFKEFAGVDAFPLCLDTTDVDEIVGIVRALAPTFGGINLEDISAPRCFEIERRLRAELDIPVFHDDQHGTAIVVLAALLNALRVVGKRVQDARIVVTGAGAAGMACANIILAEGATNVIVCDSKGALYSGRPGPRRRARSARRAHQPRARAGHGRRAARGRRRLPRTLRARCRLGGRRPHDGRGSGRLRHGQSHP
jgi:malate dehydrogenase (oxaloacetate-decarboxylating)